MRDKINVFLIAFLVFASIFAGIHNAGGTQAPPHDAEPVDPFEPPSNEAPNADFDFTYPAYTGNAVHFTDLSTDSDGNIVSWHWNFGDGTTSNEQNPSHVYNSRNEYSVTLTVTDNDGASSSVTKTVPVFSTADNGRNGVVGEIHDSDAIITISPNTDRLIWWSNGKGYIEARWELDIWDANLSGTFHSALTASLKGSIEDHSSYDEPYNGRTSKDGSILCYVTIGYTGFRFTINGNMEGKDIAPDGTIRSSATNDDGKAIVWKPFQPAS